MARHPRVHSGRFLEVEIDIFLVYRIHIDLRRRLGKFAMSDTLPTWYVNTAIIKIYLVEIEQFTSLSINLPIVKIVTAL